MPDPEAGAPFAATKKVMVGVAGGSLSTGWPGPDAAVGVRGPIDRQDVGAARGVHGGRPFLYDHLRAVLIGCYGSVAKKWGLFPGMS